MGQATATLRALTMMAAGGRGLFLARLINGCPLRDAVIVALPRNIRIRGGIQ
jgi:hypothetical protein